MARTGPIATDTTTIALGLAQIRLGPSATNINSIQSVLAAGTSVGALATTKFVGTIDLWRLESGFPLIEDTSIAIREKAQLECAFKQISPKTLAYARGLDASSGYTNAHSGEIALGNIVAPVNVRLEAIYTYPNGTDKMTIIFPRAQAAPNIELDLKAEDNANVPVTFEAKASDSSTSGGSSVWDDKPLGRIYWT